MTQWRRQYFGQEWTKTSAGKGHCRWNAGYRISLICGVWNFHSLVLEPDSIGICWAFLCRLLGRSSRANVYQSAKVELRGFSSPRRRKRSPPTGIFTDILGLHANCLFPSWGNDRKSTRPRQPTTCSGTPVDHQLSMSRIKLRSEIVMARHGRLCWKLSWLRSLFCWWCWLQSSSLFVRWFWMLQKALSQRKDNGSSTLYAWFILLICNYERIAIAEYSSTTENISR